MPGSICDLCNARATVHTQVVINGSQEEMDLCEAHYLQLVRQYGRFSSPLDSLFGREPTFFEEFLGGDFFPSPFRKGEHKGESPPLSGGRAARHARRVGYNPLERLSKHAEELLQSAAHKATELGRREVDTEHLLYALMDSDVVCQHRFKSDTGLEKSPI